MAKTGLIIPKTCVLPKISSLPNPNAITSDDIVDILPPPAKTNVQAAQKVANVAQFLYQHDSPDVNCWRAGNLSAQVVPVVFTVGAYVGA